MANLRRRQRVVILKPAGGTCAYRVWPPEAIKCLARTHEGWSVSCRDLRGCRSQGGTQDEAIENIKSAIREYLAAAHDSPTRE